MPLFVKDEQVSLLVEQYRALTGARNKTEAVRLALQRQIEAERRAVPLAERVAGIQADVARMGATDPDYDHKRFMDEMWGEQ